MSTIDITTRIGQKTPLDRRGPSDQPTRWFIGDTPNRARNTRAKLAVALKPLAIAIPAIDGSVSTIRSRALEPPFRQGSLGRRAQMPIELPDRDAQLGRDSRGAQR